MITAGRGYQTNLERYSDLNSVDLAGANHVWISFSLKRSGLAANSTLQAMSYAMGTVADIEEREREVSDAG
jgi:hypothetical protein